MTKAKTSVKKSRSAVTVNFEQAIQFCLFNLRGGRTPYLEGQPGVGKTTVGTDLVDLLDLDGHIIITPTMHNALDLRGFGYTADVMNKKGEVVGKETRFAQSTVLPSSGKWLIIIDELPDCPVHEQSGFYQILLSGKIGEYTLPKGCMVMGCGNSPEHRAAANDLSSAIRGRIATAIMVPDVDCLRRHAIRTNWNPKVIAFFREYPGALEAFDPNDFAGGCTPRDLDAVSRIELAGWPEDEQVSHMVAIGNLGNEYGSKYWAHRKLDVPSADIVIEKPLEAPIDLGGRMQMYAFCSAIAQRCNLKTFRNINTYSLRLTPVDRVSLMIDCMTADEEIINSPEWIKFHSEFSGAF